MESTKFEIKICRLDEIICFLPPQSDSCISNSISCLPWQIWIVFRIHTEMLDRNSTDFFQRSLSFIIFTPKFPPRSIMHHRKDIILSDAVLFNSYSYFMPVPPWKIRTFWLDDGRRLKNSALCTGIQWSLLHVLLINVAMISDTELSKDLVLLRKGWDEFTRSHLFRQFSAILSSH